jgi:hypothetical protein
MRPEEYGIEVNVGEIGANVGEPGFTEPVAPGTPSEAGLGGAPMSAAPSLRGPDPLQGGGREHSTDRERARRRG